MMHTNKGNIMVMEKAIEPYEFNVGLYVVQDVDTSKFVNYVPNFEGYTPEQMKEWILEVNRSCNFKQIDDE